MSSAAARTTVFDPKYFDSTSSVDIIYDMFAGVKVTLDTYKRVPTENQIEQILALVEEAMRQGGLGVGITPGYIVDGYTSQEFRSAQKLAGKHGRFAHVHPRFSSQMPPTTGILAFQEAIAWSGTYDGVILAHFTAQALNLTSRAIDYVDELRAPGAPLVLEVYHYNFGASGTGVSADYLKPENYQRNTGRTYNVQRHHQHRDVRALDQGDLRRAREDQSLRAGPLLQRTSIRADRFDCPCSEQSMGTG